MTATAKKRDEVRREKAAAMRREAEAKARKRRATTITLSVLGVLVLVVGLTIGITSATSGGSGGAVVPPASASSDGGTAGFVVGDADAPVTVDFYEDFQCPICKEFEASAGSTIATMLDQGKIKARYHMLSFLDDNATTPTTYSKRAANAAACVQTFDPNDWRAFHTALYDNQPDENTGGLANSKVISIANGVGIKDTNFVNCVNNGTYMNWVKKVESSADTYMVKKFNGVSTPTIAIDGKQVTINDMTNAVAPFTAAVQAATPSSAATPTPSASK